MRKQSPFRSTLGVEALEARDTPSVTATFNAGVLTLTGDGANDRIFVQETAGRITYGSGSVPVPAAMVKSIVIDAGAGDDIVTLTVAPATAAKTTVRGGTGTDVLDFGSGVRPASVSGFETVRVQPIPPMRGIWGGDSYQPATTRPISLSPEFIDSRHGTPTHPGPNVYVPYPDPLDYKIWI